VTLQLAIADPTLVSLAFVRIVGVMLMAPLFGHSTVPVRVRATLALLVAVLVAPGAAANAALPAGLGAAVVSELVVGFAIGFVSALVFASVSLMSELVAVQGGLGAAAVLDPSSDTSSVIVAALMRTFALLVFIAIGGHHEVIRALWISFERIPIGVPLGLPSFGAIAGLGSYVFDIGLRLAAPFTVILFVSNLVIGALGRVIPQLNLIAVQLPAQIGLTLLLLGLGAGVFFDSLAHTFRTGLEVAYATVLGDA
jgi:flagellar biosynthetic protein FliR